MSKPDFVNHPRHYNSHPSGVEAIQLTEHMSFSLGSAMKYLLRAGLKDDPIQDLSKAQWYITRELMRRSDRLSALSSVLAHETGARREAIRALAEAAGLTIAGLSRAIEQIERMKDDYPAQSR